MGKNFRLSAPVITETEETISEKGVNESSVKKIPAGTLLFSFKLTVGKVGIAGKELYTNEAIAALQGAGDEFVRKSTG